jgi:hypothetical protein
VISFLERRVMVGKPVGLGIKEFIFDVRGRKALMATPSDAFIATISLLMHNGCEDFL